MSTTDTTPAARIPVTAILAKLILLRHNKQLPEPKGLSIRAGSAVDLDFADIEDLRAWAAESGGEFYPVSVYDNASTGRRNYHTFQSDWSGTGWRVRLECWIELPSSTPLGAETVAVLEAVAA